MRVPVYFVRHGQSEWNVLRLTQGQTSHPALTALGRDQAMVAADVVARDLAERPARLLTSDLVRAVETAAIIGERLGLDPVLEPRLREQDLGDLEGRAYEDSWARAEQHDWSDPELSMAGGESVAQVRRRLAVVLSELEHVEPSIPTVLVSHGDAIRSALALLQGHSLIETPWVEVPNGSVVRVDGGVEWLDRQADI